MNSINIKIKLEMPTPGKEDAEPERTLYTTVCSLVKRFEACGDDTEKAAKIWKRLKVIYQLVSTGVYAKPDASKILKTITPLVKRYMQYDPNGVDLVTDYVSEG